MWVFGYGSLMWRPGFHFTEVQPARLAGAHRAMCIYSHVHRGTPRHPGLVLGLDRGGSCRGLAFHVTASETGQVIRYLRDREQINNVYRECSRIVRLEDGRTARALVYMARQDHDQYAGALSVPAKAQLIAQGRGKSGTSMDYLADTLNHLRQMGVENPQLEHLLAAAHAIEPSS
jgi:cation transport protein ChaC